MLTELCRCIFSFFRLAVRFLLFVFRVICVRRVIFLEYENIASIDRIKKTSGKHKKKKKTRTTGERLPLSLSLVVVLQVNLLYVIRL